MVAPSHENDQSALSNGAAGNRDLCASLLLSVQLVIQRATCDSLQDPAGTGSEFVQTCVSAHDS